MNLHTGSSSTWAEANQRCLVAELAILRATLQRHAERAGAEADDHGALREALEQSQRALGAPSALDRLCAIFGLSPFERATLLLCAGIELDSAFAAQCAAAQGERQRSHPTFSLALAALPEPHWSALTPNAPLRYWHLIELGAGPAVTTSSLRIDERILHFLAGAGGLDERLLAYLEPVGRAETMASSHEAVGERIARVWEQAGDSRPALVQLCGREAASKRAVAADACASLGLQLWSLPADRLPTSVADLELLQRFWERESALSGGALLLECTSLDTAETARVQAALRHWIERSRSPLLLSAPEPMQGILKASISLEVRRPSPLEQRDLWERALGDTAHELNGQLDRIISHFDFSVPAIHAVCAQIGSGVQAPDSAPSLWNACRGQSRAKLDDLAQRIDSKVTWDDLVLPDSTMAVLREIAVHVCHRTRVYETWGFAAKSARGLGISAMFSGASGTGKTLAAEVLANELELDLYRIDLSQVVSKYIGETEKNLRRVFDAAEESGAVLLFDEADALFGKRSEVKDSHDRYANIEVSYLLQRMEAYRGLAILTTNMKDALDPAFLRRIRFAVQFPFPDATLRSEIWRRVFPAATPTDGLDTVQLACLNVPGGNIRNMALSAAFHAAEAGEPVRMSHLVRAARGEFAKLEKPLPDSELEGWK
jgi:hypothetical protein